MLHCSVRNNQTCGDVPAFCCFSMACRREGCVCLPLDLVNCMAHRWHASQVCAVGLVPFYCQTWCGCSPLSSSSETLRGCTYPSLCLWQAWNLLHEAADEEGQCAEADQGSCRVAPAHGMDLQINPASQHFSKSSWSVCTLMHSSNFCGYISHNSAVKSVFRLHSACTPPVFSQGFALGLTVCCPEMSIDSSGVPQASQHGGGQNRTGSILLGSGRNVGLGQRRGGTLADGDQDCQGSQGGQATTGGQKQGVTPVLRTVAPAQRCTRQ